MHTVIARWVGSLALAFALQAAPPAAADGTQTTPMPEHVAIQGYDVVSYFTDGKAVKGSSEIALPFDESMWQFSNISHKEMFAADPDRYLPQYGGMCASGMALGISGPANPDSWVIVDGKLYMFSGGAADLAYWKAHAAENIQAANKIWNEHAYK